MIYTFSNGTKIRLKKVIAIEPLAIDEQNLFHIPVICEGYNKPIKVILGHSVGTPNDQKKIRMLNECKTFIETWENFVAVTP